MGVYTGAGPTVSPTVGNGISATTFGQPAFDELVALAGAWTAYTPALTAATTNPTLGTGAAQIGRYTQVGKFVIGYFQINFGSAGTAAGTGSYFISVPVAMANNAVFPIGRFNAVNGANAASADLYFQTSTTLSPIYHATWPTGTLTPVAAAAPWAWGTGNTLRGSFCYEAA